TSRQPLGLTGELTRRVPPLEIEVGSRQSAVGSREGASLPTADCRLPTADLLPPAVRLYIERAQFAHSGFTVTGPRLATIAQICRCLEGIPLAIELAAAHTRAMPLEQICARLDDQFRFLTRGSPTLRRHQTLRAAMDWSYQLLTEPERALLL